MTSIVAATVATTVVKLPVKNNTASLTGDHNNADEELEQQTAPGKAVESFSKETATDETGEGGPGGNGKDIQPKKKSFGFFAIIAALAFSGLCTSLEATITSTALPTIIADLGGADLYIWVINGFYLTQYVECSALLPLLGFSLLF